MNTKNAFRRGLNAGLPIGLGYFSVSLSFGILAVSYGFSWWQAVLISMVCVTSAGQFAGITTMLVLNGETTPEILEASDVKPHLVLADAGEILEALQNKGE